LQEQLLQQLLVHQHSKSNMRLFIGFNFKINCVIDPPFGLAI